MECGECTLCCELLPVEWLNKPVNTVCQHCDNGCMIHETKDQECKEFNCMYAQENNVPEKLRPDNSKMIFEKRSGEFIVATQDARFEVSDIAKRQIQSLVREGYKVQLGYTDFRKPKIWQPTVQT